MSFCNMATVPMALQNCFILRLSSQVCQESAPFKRVSRQNSVHQHVVSGVHCREQNGTPEGNNAMCLKCRSTRLRIRRVTGIERIAAFFTQKRKYVCGDCGFSFR